MSLVEVRLTHIEVLTLRCSGEPWSGPWATLGQELHAHKHLLLPAFPVPWAEAQVCSEQI